jgi:hypothetical protein
MMIDSELRRFSKLYATSRYMGSDVLFRKFYGLPSETVVPLSVAHGVDFGHCHRPMDVNAIEPIHWSCNAEMHASAGDHKPSLLFPHPWVMQTGGRHAPAGRGVLMIGPPPSPENDTALHDLIRHDISPEWAILIKARGNYEPSMRFWHQKGLRPVTAKGPDRTFYSRLFDLLAPYQTVVGCTFSSALVFAAAIGKQVRLIQGYGYRVYESADYEKEVNLHSPRARAVVRTFASGSTGAIRELAEYLLGFDQAGARQKALAAFRHTVASLDRPFWNDTRLRIPYKFRELAAMKLNKPNILRAGVATYVRHFRRTNICVMSINEFDVWLNGKSPSNFRLDPVKRVPGVTEPGFAPGGYS